VYQGPDRRVCNRAYAVKPRHGSWRKIAMSLVGPEELAADSEAVQKRASRQLAVAEEKRLVVTEAHISKRESTERRVWLPKL
jgi:hypothetical protein